MLPLHLFPFLMHSGAFLLPKSPKAQKPPIRLLPLESNRGLTNGATCESLLGFEALLILEAAQKASPEANGL